MMIRTKNTKRVIIGMLVLALLATVFAVVNAEETTVEEGIISVSMSINADIQNNYATTTITQTLKNTGSTEEEATFTFTIPTNGFLSEFKLEINGTTFVSKVVEKASAEEQYSSAVESGKTASIVGTGSSGLNTFDYSVNLKADQEVTYHLVYEEYLARHKGNYTYTIPLTRNSFPDEGDFGIYVNLESVSSFKDIVTPEYNTSAIETILEKKGSVTLLPETRVFTEDFKVVYSIEEYPIEGYMLNYVIGDQGYFFHVFAPTLDDLGGEALGKDIVFVIDKSGSMSGTKMTQTKDAFKSVVDDLQGTDRFNIVVFSDQITEWKTSLVDADSENIESAKAYIDEIDANGATNINGAMTTGLGSLEAESDNVPIICFLTDGVPTSGTTNTASIRENVQTANTMGAAVFCLAFGNDCDFDLLEAMALENDGTATLVEEGTDASDQIVGYYDTFSTPLVSDITFDYGNDTWDVFPRNVSSLFQGSEIVVVGRYDPDSQDHLNADVHGDTADGGQDFDQNYTLLEKTDQEFIPRYWASQKIKDLQDQITIEGETASLKENITDLALEYGFVTSYTSMILVVEVDPEGTSSTEDNRWEEEEDRNGDYESPVGEDDMYAEPGAWDDDDDDDDWVGTDEESKDGGVLGAPSLSGTGIGIVVGVIGLIAFAVLLGIILLVLFINRNGPEMPPKHERVAKHEKTQKKHDSMGDKSSKKKKEDTAKPEKEEIKTESKHKKTSKKKETKKD